MDQRSHGEETMNADTTPIRSKPRRRTVPWGAGLILLSIAGIAAAGTDGCLADITIYGRPMLEVTAAETAPRPGKETSYPQVFDLTLTVSNIGSITASHVVGTVPDNPYVGTENGSAVFGFTFIYPGKSAQTTLHMLLDSADAGGRVQPVVHFEYYAHDEEEDTTAKYAGEIPVRLTFGEPGWNRPALLLDSLTTDPGIPAPGDSCTMTVRLSNISTGDAEQVLIHLGGEEGPKPFATVGAGNVGYIARIPAHQKAETEFSLVVEGEASAGLYPVTVSLAYRNALAEDFSDMQVVYLKVQNKPALQADLIGDPPSPLLAGEPFDLSVEVINIGRQPVNVSTIELTSDDLAITNGSIYAGPLDESTSTSLAATATADTAGEAVALLSVHYLDEFNQPQTWTQTFRFTIEESAAPAEPAAVGDQTTSIFEKVWKAFLAFLGFGG
jgi:hypothetical protein